MVEPMLNVIRFKYAQMEEQFYRCSPHLVSILLFTGAYAGRKFRKPIVITNLIGGTGVHGLGRGGDIRVCMNYRTPSAKWYFTKEQGLELRDTINALWQYDYLRPWLKVAVFDVDEQHRDHIHMQVHSRTRARKLYLKDRW